MLENRLKIIQNIMKIVDIETEGQHILIDQGISFVRKIINSKDGTYQYMVVNKISKLFAT